MADNQVEDGRGTVGFDDRLDDLLNRNRAQRSRGSGLPQHRVATHRCHQSIPRPHRHREIEGRDAADDTEGLPLFEHPVPRSLRLDGEAVELAREPDGEIGDVDHLLNFSDAFGNDFSRLESNQGTEGFSLLAQGVTDLTHHLSAPRCWPVSPLTEGRPRDLDGNLVIFDRGGGNPTDQLPIVGGAAVDPVAGRLAPLTGECAGILSRYTQYIQEFLL